MNRARSSQGFSLIELLLVLGVLAILLVAAFVVYPQVRARNQVNNEVQNLAAMKAGFLSLYANGGDWTTLSRGVANQARIFPVTMNGGDYGATAPITSSWGQPVMISPLRPTHLDGSWSRSNTSGFQTTSAFRWPPLQRPTTAASASTVDRGRWSRWSRPKVLTFPHSWQPVKLPVARTGAQCCSRPDSLAYV